MSPRHPKADRPLWQKLLVLAVLLSAIFGMLRLTAALQYGGWLNRFDLPFPPFYLGAGGALWLVVGLTAAVWVWFCLPARAWVVAGGAAVLMLTYWFDRLAFFRAESARANLPFAAGLTVLLLVFTAAAARRMLLDDCGRRDGGE